VNPLHDARVRQALALALDKRALIGNTLGFNSRQISSLIQWSFCVSTPRYRSACADPSITGQWDPIARRYDPNPGKGVALLDARKLLSETRWGRGFTLDYVGATGNPVRQSEEASMAASWSRIGVTLRVTTVSEGQYGNDWGHGGVLIHGEFQVALRTIGANGLYPDWTYAMTSQADARTTSSHSPSQGNDSGIRDPVIDRALETAAATLDPRVRNRAFDAAQEEMVRQGYWDILYSRPMIYTEGRRVVNFSISVDSPNGYTCWNPWDLKVK
jgi:ABC-type transport system substrate-binding protein